MRDTSLAHAVERIYQDMAGRHRTRGRDLTVIRTARIPASMARRVGTKEYLKSGIKFPISHRVARCYDRKHRATFNANRPHTVY